MITVKYAGNHSASALIEAMPPGELWWGRLEGTVESALYLRTRGETSGGLVNVKTGKFFSEWTHKALRRAIRMNGELTITERAA